MGKLNNLFKFFRNIINLRKFNIISIQMGKVGSTSILESSQKSYQGHSWSHDLPIKYFSSRNPNTLLGEIFSRFRWALKFFIVKRRLEQAKKNKEKIKLIMGVRDPVARNISGFFQSMSHRDKITSLPKLTTEFFCYCPHAAPLYWFDNEIFENFGINIYDHPFDKEKGLTHFTQGIFDVLIYKVEQLNNLEKEIGNYLEINDFKVKKENQAQNSWYAKVYSEFCREIRFDKSYLDLMYKSKMATHFYNEIEIESLYSKWSKP